MITYRSRFLTRAEVWFDNEPMNAGAAGRASRGISARADWILYHQRPHPLPAARSRSFYTLLIDLTQSYDQLLGQLSQETAYKIRRARERDKIVCECCDPRDPAVLDGFERMYNAFATMKGLPMLHRPRLESLASMGVLDISSAKDPQGNVLVYHANYRDSRRATQLESPSLYRALSDSAARNFNGRANRYLTWCDLLRYKEQGLKFFDFGGWHLGKDPEMLNINEFKRGFGGQVVREYQCEQTLTLKGRLVLCAAKLLSQARSILSQNGHESAETPYEEFADVPLSVAMKQPNHEPNGSPIAVESA